MGVEPTYDQMDEIMGLTISLSVDGEEVAQYMSQLQKGSKRKVEKTEHKAKLLCYLHNYNHSLKSIAWACNPQMLK